MILLIDNYDSFSYNLYQLIGYVNPNIKVIRNDEMTVEDIGKEIDVGLIEAIVLSPGPGKPADAGICIEVVKKLGGKVPILGVCLGHQAIFEASGGAVSYAKELMHGKKSDIKITDKTSEIFHGLPDVIEGARYHSLAAVRETLPVDLKIIAETNCGEIMAVSHVKYKIYGLQFHPESILTPDGGIIIKNFLRTDNYE
ncbi:MAG: aminodeoxychorismate/anthranilate synthase component II [Oscillospiraceae bacterium]|nr:aminodeoxychorismate/anthranilate synthase component II [Oscillospiraceae bacterium]